VDAFAVGLVYGPTGAIELDPDARVQQAVRLVLQKFDELGSTRQALLWLRRERISVPVTRQGRGGRQTEWAPPPTRGVHGIITILPRGGVRVWSHSDSLDDCRRPHPTHLGPRAGLDQWQVVIPTIIRGTLIGRPIGVIWR